MEAVVYPVADLLTQRASIPFRRKGSAWETHKQRKETTYMQLRSTARCPIVMSRTNDGFFGHFATHQTNLDKAELYLLSLRRCTKTAYHEAWKNKRYEAREAWSAWGMKARWVWSMNAEKKSIVWVGSCDVPKRQHLPAYPEASLLVVRVSIIRDTPWGSLG